MSNSPTPLIKLEEASFSYNNSEKALQNVSLEINKGELVALVGHNGSGKSTLAKHLNGLLKPSSGKVLINGRATANNPTSKLAKDVALLFQNPDDQICKKTVKDEISFGPQNLGYSNDKINELVTEQLKSFNLLSHAKSNPHDLGYSQRKRLALASVLAMDTQAIVLDEPTAGLDSNEIKMLKYAIKKLQQNDRTVIMISHDMDFIAENTSRAICLKKGHKVFDGSVLDFFTNKKLITSCGLLSPQIARLHDYFKLSPVKLTPEGFIDAFMKRV